MSLRSLQARYLTLLVLRWLPIGLLAPVLVLILLERDLSLAQVGPVLAAYSLVTLLAELPTGGVADAYGRCRVLVVASLCQLGFVAWLLAFDGPVLMTIGAMLGGASRALDSGPLEAWFVDEARHIEPSVDLEARLARGVSVDGVTLAVGSVVGGFIASLGGRDLDVVLWAALGAQAVHAAVAATTMRETAPVARPTGTLSVLASTATLVRSSRNLSLLMAAGLGLGLALTSVETLFQPRFDDLLQSGDATTIVLGFVLAAAFVGSAVGAEVGPRLRRRMGWRASRFLVALGLAQAALFLGTAAADTAVGTAAGIVAIYAALGMAHPVVSTLLHDETPSEARTAMVSARSLSLQTGGFVGSLTFPVVAATWSIPLAWVLAGVLVAAAGAIYGGLRPDQSTLSAGQAIEKTSAMR